MAEKKIQARIRQKVDTKANWDKATNFVPLKGEYIYYSDLHKVKVGDGTTKVGALPFLADSDTHSITGMYIGATNAKANAATTNGNTYLKLYDDNTKRAEFKIVGSGATKVSSDANGNITISSTDTNTHQSVADKNPTLAWGAKSTVATIGSTDIHVTMPANPNTDTHFITGLYVGKASEKSNSATTNGNTYLKLFDNDTKRSQHLIHGTGLTTVASDASGTITINSTLPTNLVTTDTEQTVTGTKHFNAITANTIGTGSDANNYFQSQKFRGEGDANTYYHAVDFGYAGHNQVDFYEYGGNYNFYINTQANTDSRQLLFGINPSGIKIPPAAGAKVLGTNAEGQVEPHSLGIADISSLQSTLDGKVNSSSLATVAKTGSYNDLSNKPTIPDISNLVPYTGATKDVDLGKHSLSISNKSDGNGKIIVSSQGMSEDDVYCEITSTGVQVMDPGAGTGYNVNYIDVNGFKVYLPNATYVPSGAEVFVTKSNLSNLLDKGSTSTNNNQVVYNPVEMKKALTVPSVTVSDIKNAAMVSTDANGKLTKSNLPAAFEQISVIDKTIQSNDNIEVTEVYLSCEGMEDHYAWDRLIFSAPGSPAASNIKYYYNYMGQKTELTPTNASALNSAIGNYGESIAVAINRNESNPTITYLPNGLVLGRGYYSNKEGGDVFTYYVYDSPLGYMPALREIAPDTSTQQWKLTSTSGTVTTVNICVK